MSDLSQLASFVQLLAVIQAAFEARSSKQTEILRELLAAQLSISQSADLADVSTPTSYLKVAESALAVPSSSSVAPSSLLRDLRSSSSLERFLCGKNTSFHTPARQAHEANLLG